MEHYTMLLDHVTKFGASEVVVLMAAYTLAPESRYPTQLSQAASMLNYLLEVEKLPPSKVS